MSETKQMLFARNLICVCIDSYDNSDFQGRVWHQYSDEDIAFKSVNTMLKIVDELMDEWDFPQKGLDTRSFIKEDKKRKAPVPDDDELTIDKVQRIFGQRNIQNKRGKLKTFVVQISFRQQATWQGHVIVSEDNEKRDFSSAMGLLRIMDEFVRNT